MVVITRCGLKGSLRSSSGYRGAKVTYSLRGNISQVEMGVRVSPFLLNFLSFSFPGLGLSCNMARICVLLLEE